MELRMEILEERPVTEETRFVRAKFTTEDGKEIIVENPEVSVIDLRGIKIFQVAGGEVTEKTVEKKLAIPEEDVQLVAQQANVSLEEARAALEETKGDLAQAILLLSQK